MRIEKRNKGGAKKLKKYRVVIQDGYIYHDELKDAVREALAWAHPHDTIDLPDGSRLTRKEAKKYVHA